MPERQSGQRALMTDVGLVVAKPTPVKLVFRFGDSIFGPCGARVAWGIAAWSGVGQRRSL
ncbi:hypothetical protein BX257_1496 [Streptomyces sp. 3212.3]|nr:hypothetical protein BX257_1496 [Streptomyces sp. 3212.3]